MLDNCLSLIRVILIWEYPVVSIFSFLLLNIIFWWISNFNWRFYGIIFSTSTFVFIVENATGILGYKPENKVSFNDYYYASRKMLTKFSNNLITFRSSHLNLFRLYMFAASIALFIIGCNTSGLCLIYIAMTTIYVLSLATKLFPEIAKGIYVELYYTFQPPYEITEDDLIPTSVNDLDKENDNESADGDSCSNSLITGMSIMPSYMEIEATIDKLEDDFEITTTQLPNATQDSDTDSENILDTNIEPSLLEDSEESSSSDDKFSEGILFPSLNQTKGDSIPQYIPKPNNTLQTISSGLTGLTNLGSVGIHLVSNILHSQQKPTSHSSSESDFEILDMDS